MKYYVIAGEASGDLHGSNLMRGILAADPEAEFRFWGGDLMQAAAPRAYRVKHYTETAIMGFLEVLQNLGKIQGFFKLCKADIRGWCPDVVILIDYPGFNLRIARFAHSLGIKTFYYIAPKVWAWKEGRVKKLRRYVDRLFVIFPFEIDYFRRHGIEVFYAGNPTVDALREQRPLEQRENVIALVAGSRVAEIKYNLPRMVEIARLFPDYRFVVTAVPWLGKSLYDKYLDGSNVEYVCGDTYRTIARSRAALVTSGTATLETALLGTPQVVCYRASSVSMWIARRLVKLRFISLVNLVVDREVVRELIQNDFSVAQAAAELRAILPSGQKLDLIERGYAELRERLGGEGASQRVGARMVEILRG